jgi:hypothetical protein
VETDFRTAVRRAWAGEGNLESILLVAASVAIAGA